MMPGIGWIEIFLLLLLAIVVIPPKDIPAFIRSAGALIGRVRSMIHHATRTLEEADLPSVSSIRPELLTSREISHRKNKQNPVAPNKKSSTKKAFSSTKTLS